MNFNACTLLLELIKHYYQKLDITVIWLYLNSYPDFIFIRNNEFGSDLMKKWILVLAILAIVVTVSGCTNNQTAPANKTYSANGLSFIYPGSWSELDKTAYQSALDGKGELLAVVGDGSNSAFGIARLSKMKNQTNVTLNNLVAYHNSTLKNNGTEYVSEEPVTVDGAKGYEITVKASGNYFSSVLFIKNSTGYLAVFESLDNDQQTLDQILSSLKVSND